MCALNISTEYSRKEKHKFYIVISVLKRTNKWLRMGLKGNLFQDRVVRGDLSGEVTFRLKPEKEPGMQKARERVFQTKRTAGTKAVRQENLTF